MCSPFGAVFACAMIHPLIACVTASYALAASFFVSTIPSSSIISTSSGFPVRYTAFTIRLLVALPMPPSLTLNTLLCIALFPCVPLWPLVAKNYVDMISLMLYDEPADMRDEASPQGEP